MANEKETGGSDDQSNQRGGSGNFANDPQRASEAGKKGGQQSHGGSGQTNQSGSGRSQQSGVTSSNEDDDSEQDNRVSNKGGSRPQDKR